MSTVVKDLGAVSAYAYAVEKGYTGTEAEFAELMADYAEVGQRAEDAADRAEAALDEFTSVTADATTLPEGSSATAEYSDGHLTLGIPKGDKGDTGAKGDGAVYAVIGNTASVIPVGTDGYLTRAYTITIPVTFYSGKDNVTGSVTSSDLYISRTSGGSGEMDTVPGSKYRNVKTATIIYAIPAGWRVGTGRITLTVTIGTTTLTYYHAYTIAPTGPTGNGIASVAKTGTSGLVDTYTITYTNGNTSIFTVTNGAEAVDNTLTIAGRAADAKKTGDEISELKEDLTTKADLDELYKAFPTDTASGAIASFTDGAELPIKSLTVDIEPIQDLHGYDNPWPAGGGKNKFFISASRDAYSWPDGCGFSAIAAGDSSITFNGTASAAHTFSVSGAALTLPAGTYTASMSVSSKVQFILKKTGTQDVIANITDTAAQFTLTEETTMDLQFNIQIGASFSNQAIEFQIEAGSTATAYAPYSNICPISGHTQAVVTRTGVNVWDEEWEVGSINADNGENVTATDRIRSKNYISVVPGVSYYFKASNTIGLRLYDGDKHYVTSTVQTNLAYTIPANIRYVRFIVLNTTTYNHDISINYPSTDHDYHPYTGTSITISLGQTVYGGKLDVLSGELVVDRVHSTIDENDNIEIASNSSGFLFYITNKCTGAFSNDRQICDRLEYAESGTASTLYSAESGFVAYPNGVLYFKINKTINTVADIKSYLASNGAIKVCYELATPITVTLTPNELSTLLGANNIWSDAGEVTAEYRADPTLFIQRKIAEALS